MTEISPDGTSTADCIAFHAAERPGAVALIGNRRAISFAEFSRDIGKFSAALRELRLTRGSVIAIGCADLYTHWLLLLACERLNVATASFHRMEAPEEYRELLAGVDLVLSDRHFPIADVARHHPITEAWVRETLARGSDGDEPSVKYAPSDLMRVIRSSGSTGRQKRLAVTRHMYEALIARYAWRYQLSQNSRYMLTLPFTVMHIYGCATACLRAGGTVVSVPTQPGEAGVFAEYGITHITLQPVLLKQILEDLPPDFAKPADLAVFTFGSPMSDGLGERTLRQLAIEVTECFGCNEVGNISGRRMSQRDAFATVAPDVEIEVIDEAGRPVPRGEPGLLRIRSESMVEGYLDDPETTRRFFKDGWFYSSDMVILDGPRRLKVLGRGDEMIVIVGNKWTPDDLEALVTRHVDVGDVGICTFAKREGIPEVYVAIANARVDQRELLDRVTRAFSGVPLGTFHVVILPAIPRNDTGKIQRTVLKETIAAALGLEQI